MQDENAIETTLLLLGSTSMRLTIVNELIEGEADITPCGQLNTYSVARVPWYMSSYPRSSKEYRQNPGVPGLTITSRDWNIFTQQMSSLGGRLFQEAETWHLRSEIGSPCSRRV